MQPIKDMVLGYLEMGPVAWAVLFVVLWVLYRIGGFLLFLLIPNRKDES